MVRTSQLIVASFILLTVAGAARAAATFDELKAKGAQAVLAEGDRRHYAYKTAKWVFTMTLKPASGDPRTLKFSTWQKGSDKRLTRFLAPGQVKGMSVLVRGANVMYVYSPQTDNVRRVAAHAKKQNMLGSDMTYEDMAQIDFASEYDARFDADAGAFAWLELTVKPGIEKGWQRLRVRVDKKLVMFDRVEYFDGKKKVKIQERYRPEVLDGWRAYRKIVMKDLATRHQTTIFMESQKINDEIPDSVYKKRSLIRGN